MGIFHTAFATVDFEVDFGICKLMNLSHHQAHLMTAGMMFGPKARLLADLLGRSGHPMRDALLAPFNRIRGNSKRDIIAHGYIYGDENTVTFLQRITSGEFTAREHTFTLPEFGHHVLKFVGDVQEFGTVFSEAYPYDADEPTAFADAAMSLNRKSKMSPQ